MNQQPAAGSLANAPPQPQPLAEAEKKEEASLPIATLVQYLRADVALVQNLPAAKWNEFDSNCAMFMSGQMDKKAFMDSLKEILEVLEPKVLETIKAAMKAACDAANAAALPSPAAARDEAMPPKRKEEPSAETTTAAEAKRYRQAIDELASEFVCPITQELPVDPVNAEDGRVYERKALVEWFEAQSRRNAALKSPVTNEPMGTRLSTALQVRNNIRAMVKSGAISGSKADAWKLRMKDEEEVAQLRAMAEAGDADAMYQLGRLYYLGERGLDKDPKQAWVWLEKAADLGHATALCTCGFMCVEGHYYPRALIYYGRAAEAGSQLAMFRLGDFHMRKMLGLDNDPKTIAKWFGKMTSAKVQDAPDDVRKEAAKWLVDNATRYRGIPR